jgi:hypothetical protein
MVSYRRTAVTVYESEIDAAFRTARGSVYQNMRFVAFGNVTIAQKLAPRRTGRMQKSIGYTITPAGKYQFRYTMTVGADYAIYTLEGTTGPIYPSNSKLLWVRPAPYSRYHSRTPRISVEGQTGHNWLRDSVIGTFKVLRLN